MRCCLSVDADWAHPEVVVPIFSLLLQAEVPFTFFATEDQSVPENGRMEIAWHPNFERGSARCELDELARLFPRGRGVRPHRLAWGDCDHSLLRELGIGWTSSTHHPGRPWPIEREGFTEFPITWGDNEWFRNRVTPDWEMMRSETEGAYVLNIHPIHVFLNTTSLDQYEQAKLCYRSPEVLDHLIDRDRTGVLDIFERILEMRFDPRIRFVTMSQAQEELVEVAGGGGL